MKVQNNLLTMTFTFKLIFMSSQHDWFLINSSKEKIKTSLYFEFSFQVFISLWYWSEKSKIVTLVDILSKSIKAMNKSVIGMQIKHAIWKYNCHRSPNYDIHVQIDIFKCFWRKHILTKTWAKRVIFLTKIFSLRFYFLCATTFSSLRSNYNIS